MKERAANDLTEYFNDLLKNGKSPKKQIAVYLDDDKIEHIDMVIRLFADISGSKSISRNSFIEEAVNKFVTDAIEYLWKTQGIDVESAIRESHQNQNNSDTSQAVGKGMEQTM